MIWHSNSINDVINQLNTNTETGLSSTEALNRYEHISSKIKIKQRKRNYATFLLKELQSSVYALIVASAAFCIIFHLIFGILSLTEPILLTVFALIKAAVSAFFDYSGSTKLQSASFEERAAINVMRDGKVQLKNAGDIVPGDIIYVAEGDYVPVDARLIRDSNLHCDEYAITGETVPTQKDAAAEPVDIARLSERGNMLFAGSHILSGNGVAVVTEIRDYTELAKKKKIDGKSTASLQIETRLAQLEKLIATGTVAAYALLFLVAVIFGTVKDIYKVSPFLSSINYALMLVAAFSVSFRMSTINTISTTAVSAGIKNMRKKGIVINDPKTIDKISKLDVVCADKTGTLTQNKMVLAKMYNGINEINVATDTVDGDCKMLLRLAALCCDGDVKLVKGISVQSGDATQTAIIAASMEHLGLGKYELDNIYPRMATIPFDPNRKLMTTVNVIDGQKYVIVRGAAEALVGCCDGDNLRYLEEAENLSSENLRVVAVAMKPIDEYSAEPTPEELECNLRMIGLLGLSDLLRPDSKDAVNECKSAGMKVVMLTGDRKSAAFATAASLGIAETDESVITGDELDKLSPDELCENIEKYNVFAQVDSAHRVRLVRAFQDAGHFVAVTGDTGANTASLRVADVGYSMGKSGSDSAVCESEVIIEDDSFSSVADSVRSCRAVYHNIAKSLKFYLSSALGIFLATFIGVICFGTSICTNTEILALAALAVFPMTVGIVYQNAETDDLNLIIDNDSGIFQSKFLLDTVFFSIIYCLCAIVAFSVGLSISNVSPTGFAFATLAITLLVCGIFSRTDTLCETVKYNNKMLLISSAVFFLLLIVTSLIGIGRFTALPFYAWVLAIVIAAITLLVNLAIKLIRKQQ